MSPSDAFAAITPLVTELEKLGVPYYIGGSAASSAHGIPRLSLDVDIVADLAARHVAPLVEALKRVYYIDGPMIHEAIAHRSCFNLIHLATSFKVDVFVVKNRPYDRAALARVESRSPDPTNPSARFLFASPEDTVLAKLEWYRLGDEVSDRQWGDIVGVLQNQGKRLDRQYLDEWAAELGVADLLAKAWKEVETIGL